MISSNELRLNNWVEYKLKTVSGYAQISSIRSNGGVDLKYLSAFMIASFDVLRPIDLTPKILEKCGFLKYLEGEYYKADIRLYLSKDGWNIGYYINNLKSLHQLQNLYFALTGSELNIVP